MKPQLFLKIICILYFNFQYVKIVTAQSYIPFPETSANWNVSWSDVDCYVSGLQDGVFTYYYNGDTVINSNTFHKVYRSGLCIQCCYPPYLGRLNGYMGGLRNDSINKKVLWIRPDLTTDEILYNFNIVVGDTLKGWLASACPDPTIISIDSILIGSKYHSRYNFVGGICEGALIEGIGSTLGLLEPFFTFEGGGVLNCMRNMNNIYFPDSSGSCGIIDFVSENKFDKNQFILIRSKDKIDIQFDDNFTFNSNFSVSIYDILGRQVFNSQNQKYYFSIFVNGLGYYVVKVVNGRRVKYQKG